MGSPLALFSSALVLASTATGTTSVSTVDARSAAIAVVGTGTTAAHLAARSPDLVPGSAPELPSKGEPSPAEGASPLSVALVSAGMAGVVLGTGVVAWWDRGFTAIHWNDTGLLEKNTYAGGSDKTGHTYTSYVSMRAMAPIYRALGISREGSIIGASLFTFMLWNGFEVIDGFTSYGLEYGDVLANTVGIGLGALTELYPALDSVVGLRLGYVPSRDFLEHDKTLLKFVNDYTGMLFYLDLKLKGVFELAGRDPGLARYFLTGLTWTTKDYSPVRRDATRERQLGVHLSLSLAEVLRAFGDGDAGVEGIARFFDFYAVPFLSVIVARELNEDRWILSFGVSNRAEVDL